MSTHLNKVECSNEWVDDRAPAHPKCREKIYVNVPGDTTPTRHEQLDYVRDKGRGKKGLAALRYEQGSWRVGPVLANRRDKLVFTRFTTASNIQFRSQIAKFWNDKSVLGLPVSLYALNLCVSDYAGLAVVKMARLEPSARQLLSDTLLSDRLVKRHAWNRMRRSDLGLTDN